VLFKQERLGENLKPFTLMKFRTMVVDAEKECGPVWSSECDPRVTKVGKVLRKTRLDEIPQLINVLKGDMSFVGPRPIRKHFADMLAEKIPYYRMRFLVKPGVTGWAQVKHDYAGSEEGQAEKLEYDLFYIQNQSLLFDLYIFLKTIQTIIFRPGQ
jgi:lipopolysaccharide/colanic/teichoic acid biosynthesis glycosyltransferase